MNITRTLLFCLSIFLFFPAAQAQLKKIIKPKREAPPQGPVIQRVDPTFWWVGMLNPELELLVYGPEISKTEVSLEYPGVELLSVQPVENPNYLFVTLRISPGAAPGIIQLRFSRNGLITEQPYELKARIPKEMRSNGLSQADFIYLVMPDRFANGDSANDVIAGMEQAETPGAKYQRHGGDLRGIIEHLDYLEDLGVTTLWLNPVQENNQPKESYHGYAITDHYRIDRRFGSNEDYLELVNKCHERGMKVVMDIIHNHIGDQHYLFRDLPARDWVNRFDEFTRTNYRATSLMDPYASERDRRIMSDGWFDQHMPDLNQRNAQVANYLIQSHIWWVEYANLDGYRLDTYAYPDQDFMAKWCQALRREFPYLTLFGEVWDHGPGVQSFFGERSGLDEKSLAALPGMIDFQLHFAINDALNQNFGWTEGVTKIYYTLAQDYLYRNASRNVTFLDNHDVGRFFSTVGEDLNKFKVGTGILLTTRGIPSIYYGTEVLMKNNFDWGNHDVVRENFPGGFPDGQLNKFSAAGRTVQEHEAYTFIRNLAQYRKQHPALHSGKLMQFVPEDGIYVYFRYDENESIMITVNSNKDEKTLELARFEERLRGFRRAKDITTGRETAHLKDIKLPGMSIGVWELER